MLARDIMTTAVISADPAMSVQQVARLLSERGISAVPVVDAENRVIGIISEGDLLHRQEIGTLPGPLSLEAIASGDQIAYEYLKMYGRTVENIMTRNVISVKATTSVADIVFLLERNSIKRVPVIEDGKLVGIVSRADLVRTLARHPVERPGR